MTSLQCAPAGDVFNTHSVNVSLYAITKVLSIPVLFGRPQEGPGETASGRVRFSRKGGGGSEELSSHR